MRISSSAKTRELLMKSSKNIAAETRPTLL